MPTEFNDRRSSERESTILSSLWTGLSPHLIAKFYPVKRITGGEWEQSRDKRVVSASDKFSVDDGYEVHCPITDGTKEMSFNWHSPFENAGAESRIPTLSAMLQSGSAGEAIQALGKLAGVDVKNTGAGDALASAFGRTGITKLNSTQVFTGMPGVKFTMTLHFRALINPISEVEDPIRQLEEWAHPQYLAGDGVIANTLKNGAADGFIGSVFPSVSPQIIGLKYRNSTYAPLVIENVSEPFTNPVSADGAIMSCSVQITLATLTAQDRRDVQKIYRR